MKKNKINLANPVKIESPVNEPAKNVLPAKPTHRYFCDACTGVAFYHRHGDTVPGTVKCQSCGMVARFKEQNLIAL